MKKNNTYALVMAVAISLLVVVGAITLLSTNSTSFFVRLKIRNKKIQILYNYNLFDASTYTNNIVKKYNNKLQVITLNGKMNSTTIEFGKLDVSLKKGEKYRVIVKNVGGEAIKQ